MELKVFHDNNTITSYTITKETLLNEKYINKISYIASTQKEENALKIFQSFFSNAKSILFDTSNKSILSQLSQLNVQEFDDSLQINTIFDPYEFSFLYFTSGTTGLPVGALKTKENILSELQILDKLLTSYDIKRVIVTVPFIHFYGSLFGLFLPLFKNIDIILKEHFLPNDLLNIIDKNSLVVTTPLYIKALNQLSSTKDLSHSLFVSSTAPLLREDARIFNQKFSSHILQIFGSTETGGIAYKFDDELLWTPLESVLLSTNDDNELKVTSPFISDILFEKKFKKTNQEIQTFDYVEFEKEKFKLIGRSSQMLKISGKRYSTIQMEHILEQIDGIEKALVFVDTSSSSLKNEVLNITLESKKVFTHKDIRNILQKELSNIKFSINLEIVNKIPTSSVGKKLRIEN